MDTNKKIVVCDIDGTIAKMSTQRKQFIDEKRNDWDYFYSLCFNDDPIFDIINIIRQLDHCASNIVFCTGRREEVRGLTEQWIKKYFPYMSKIELIMRPNGDHRCDSSVKPAILAKAGYTTENVICIFEDRSRVVKRWRELGFTCVQVAEGDF